MICDNTTTSQIQSVPEKENHPMSATSNKTDYSGVIAAFFATFLWGGAYVAMKFSLQDFHPMSMIFLRLAIASCACLAFIPAMKGKQRYTKGDWWIFLVLILCEPCFYFIFEGYALKYTSASQAGMLVSTLPIFVGVFGYFLLKEKISRNGWIGCFIAICGAVWLSMGAVADEHAPNPLLGNSLQFCAMMFAAFYAICVRRLSSGYSAIFITSVQAWGGTLFFLPVMFVPGMGIPTDASLTGWLSIAYLGVGVSLGAYGLYNFSITRMPAAKASMCMNLIPVFTLIFGMIILGERLTAMQYIASAMVLGGVIFSQRS